jgi:hypothetical protein
VSLWQLEQAARHLEWRLVVAATVLLVLSTYMWDAFCLRWLFAQPAHELAYSAAFRIRGIAYLAGAINYGLGHAMVAWMMSKVRGLSLVAALSRCVLLAYHDIAVLLGLGLLGSIASAEPQARSVQTFCSIGLALLLGLGALSTIMPAQWRSRLKETRWAASLGSWSWARSAQLALLRVVYFGISLLYASVALPISGVRVDESAVLSAVPIALLAEGLPVSVSGLGARETVLLYFLNAEQPEAVLALGLVWSTGLIAGRMAIGLAQLWLRPSALQSE